MQNKNLAGHICGLSAMTSVAAMLGGCASLGAILSPYSENFSCKNRDHGQCIDPGQAHADAVAGVASRSDPGVTQEKALLGKRAKPPRSRRGKTTAGPYDAYQDSIYRELQGLIDAPETPMLRQGRTVRTLILPYADRARPDRLYMPRYVYAILEKPQWVVGDYLAMPPGTAGAGSVLQQVQDKPGERAVQNLVQDLAGDATGHDVANQAPRLGETQP